LVQAKVALNIGKLNRVPGSWECLRSNILHIFSVNLFSNYQPSGIKFWHSAQRFQSIYPVGHQITLIFATFLVLGKVETPTKMLAAGWIRDSKFFDFVKCKKKVANVECPPPQISQMESSYVCSVSFAQDGSMQI